jgi:hypothetical protein
VPEPYLVLLGPGASRDAGVEIFGRMSSGNAKRLGAMLADAWEECREYSRAEGDGHAAAVGWSGDIRDYFMTGGPKQRLRRCLSILAMEYYMPMMSAAWEFVYMAVKDKRPATIHAIVRELDAIGDAAGNSVLIGAITTNVDGLEYATGIDPEAVIPGYGSVLLKQPRGTGTGREAPSAVESVAEIRSGRYRPAIVLDGEDAIMPSDADLDATVGATNGTGTLIVYGMSDTSDISAFLENARFATTIVVDSDWVAADRVQDMLDRSSEITARNLRVPGCEIENPDPGVVCGFQTEHIFGLRGASDLLALFRRLYTGFDAARPGSRSGRTLRNAAENQALYTR